MNKRFVIGNSFSISDMDWNRIGASRIISFGVNRILRIYPVQNLVISDEDVMRDEIGRILQYQPRLFLTDRIFKRFLDKLNKKKITIIDIRKRRDLRMQTIGPIHNTLNMGCVALELAYRELAGKGVVGLLGMDMFIDKDRGRRFCKVTGGASTDAGLKKGLEWLAGIKKQLNSENFKVYNLSPLKGPMDLVVERKTVDDFIAMLE